MRGHHEPPLNHRFDAPATGARDSGVAQTGTTFSRRNSFLASSDRKVGAGGMGGPGDTSLRRKRRDDTGVHYLRRQFIRTRSPEANDSPRCGANIQDCHAKITDAEERGACTVQSPREGQRHAQGRRPFPRSDGAPRFRTCPAAVIAAARGAAPSLTISSRRRADAGSGTANSAPRSPSLRCSSRNCSDRLPQLEQPEPSPPDVRRDADELFPRRRPCRSPPCRN